MHKFLGFMNKDFLHVLFFRQSIIDNDKKIFIIFLHHVFFSGKFFKIYLIAEKFHALSSQIRNLFFIQRF